MSVVVANKGTVTLEALIVSDSIDSAGCTASGSFLLEQGEQHECIPVQQVSTVNRTELCSIRAAIFNKRFLRKQLQENVNLLQLRGNIKLQHSPARCKTWAQLYSFGVLSGARHSCKLGLLPMSVHSARYKCQVSQAAE